MHRRTIIGTALAAAAGGVASPAIGQSAPDLSWRLASVFPKSLDIQFGTTEQIVRQVSEMTDGKFKIQAFAAGEIVPALAVADAVGSGTVEMGHTGAYFSIGKSPAFAMATSIPFGLNARQQNSWMYDGGGFELYNAFFEKHNLYGLPAGNTGAQMGGWFRKEINSLEDVKGLKFRVGGLSGQVFAKMGAVPQQLAPGDIYTALERGTIDAAEWVAPYDDEKLGFVRVAPYYYYPGWFEGQSMLHVFINLRKWQDLPKSYQTVLASATSNANTTMLAKMDNRNAPALRRLVAAGAQLRSFSQDVMEAGFKATTEIMDAFASSNADFKAIYDPYKAFLAEQSLWYQIADLSYDNAAFRLRRR